MTEAQDQLIGTLALALTFTLGFVLGRLTTKDVIRIIGFRRKS